MCTDTVGSYTCTCNTGWSGDGTICSNINECEDDDLNDCDENAICTDNDGSWTCACTGGWSGDGITCTNINECAADNLNDCDTNATCSDTDGGYECTCADGFTGDGVACDSAAPTVSPSKMPSKSPTISPTTAQPTASPSSLPSLQPSIVEQFVTTEGSLSVNVNICAFTSDQLADYIQAALESIGEVTGCGSVSSCSAEITSACGQLQSSSRMLQTSSRMLQTSDWQLNYEINESFTCEYASCDSSSDSATTVSIIDSIVAPVEASLSSNQFLSILSTNILNTGSFDADIVACLAVWGIVGEPQLEVAPTNSTGLYYPDWEYDSGTCLQGKAPLYMELEPEIWLYDTLEDCCERYFGGWNENKCRNIKGSGLWYVSHSLEKCVTDCEEGQGATCGGLANPFSDDLFADPRTCCVSDLPWVFIEFCEAESLLSDCYAGTGKYYRGDTVGNKFCVKDCDPEANGDATCGGLVEDTYVVLYDTAEECCSAEHDWMTNELCAARSDHIVINKYWPDKINSKCILDSLTPADDLSISIYNSTADCCSEAINWLSQADCQTASGDDIALAASNMFFVDWRHERCAQDCEGAAPCGGVGHGQAWDDMYDTLQQCCDVLHWIPREDCVSESSS